MLRFRSIVGDTILLAVVTIFSYYLFLMEENGYLEAYGLKGLGGIIPLQAQDIIPSVVTTVFVTSMAFAIMTFVIFRVAAWTKTKSKRARDILYWGTASLLLVLLVSPLLIVTYLTDKTLFLFVLGFVILEIVVVIGVPVVASIVKGGVGPKFFLASDLTKLLEKVVLTPLGRIGVTGGALLIMLLPLYAHSLGFINARTPVFSYTVKIENKKYIVIRRYEDKIVLAELKGNRVQPLYKILVTDDQSFEIQAERIDPFEFGDLHPTHKDSFPDIRLPWGLKKGK